MWLDSATTWIASYFWARLLLAVSAFVLALLVRKLGGWEKPKGVGAWVWASIGLSLLALLVPAPAAARIAGAALSCIVLPSLAFVVALAMERKMAKCYARDRYFGYNHGRWILAIPVVLWLAFWIGGWHGDWAIGYFFAVVGLTVGIRLAWPKSDGDHWPTVLLAGIVLAASLVWAFGPWLRPLPFWGWYWGTTLLLLLLPKSVVWVTELFWYRRHPLHHWDESFREQAVRTLRNQKMLARVATFDRSWSIRELALKRITDERALLRVAKAQSGHLQERAAGRIKDPAMLAELAETVPDAGVRKAAVGGIRDRAMLVRIAKLDGDASVRREAVEHLIDPSLLVDLAKTAGDDRVRHAALGRLEGEAFLADLATTAGDADIRKGAVERVADQQVLARVAKQDGDERVRVVATAKLASQSLLAELVRTDPSAAVRLTVASRIDDQWVLAQVAGSDADVKVRKAAIERVEDVSVLGASAKADPDAAVRLVAIKRVTDQAVLASVAEHDRDSSVAEAAVERLDNQAALARVVSIRKEIVVRKAAVGRITDEQVLGRIAMNDADAGIRRSVVPRIESQAVLAQVAAKDSDDSVRVEAIERLTDHEVLEKLVKTEGGFWPRRCATQRWMHVLADQHASADDGVRRSAADRLWRQLACLPRAKRAPFPLLARFRVADLPNALFDALERGPKEARKLALKTLIAREASREEIDSRVGTPKARTRQTLDEIAKAGRWIPRTMDRRDDWEWALF
jgi:hypothetical protein